MCQQNQDSGNEGGMKVGGRWAASSVSYTCVHTHAHTHTLHKYYLCSLLV